MVRKWQAGLWILVALLVIPEFDAWAQKPPIKVGMLYPLTGVYASLAEDGINGAKLAFDEVHNEIAGRKVEIIIEDDRAQADVALTKARKLLEGDRVHVLMGIIWSPSAVAVRDYVHSRKTPLVISEAAIRVVTQELRSPYIFRASFAAGQDTRPFGSYVCGKLGHKRVFAVAFNNAFGREQTDFFEGGCNESGGKVIGKIFPPIGEPDFAPYLAQITAANPDAVWALFSGTASIRFLQQYKEYGLKEKYPLVGFGALIDKHVLRAVGDAALGVITAYFYTPALETSENKRFVRGYREKYKDDPDIISLGGYTAAKVIRQAANAINGDVEDTDRFLRALRGLRFEDPRGPFRFDAFQNPIQNMYIRKVERVDGRLVNTVLDTLKEVEQYWPKGKPQP